MDYCCDANRFEWLSWFTLLHCSVSTLGRTVLKQIWILFLLTSLAPIKRTGSESFFYTLLRKLFQLFPGSRPRKLTTPLNAIDRAWQNSYTSTGMNFKLIICFRFFLSSSLQSFQKRYTQTVRKITQISSFLQSRENLITKTRGFGEKTVL